ncbi:MAG: ParA family protein [Symploca sp. SIO3E6]|nr:ParA family protein [Caldora sp. SIO3E6]
MIISIVGYKGGVGKTTTAVHLAGYLQTKVPTLLVDSDKNRSALVTLCWVSLSLYPTYIFCVTPLRWNYHNLPNNTTLLHTQ